MIIDYELYNAGIDVPDSRDITLDEIGMGEINLS